AARAPAAMPSATVEAIESVCPHQSMKARAAATATTVAESAAARERPRPVRLSTPVFLATAALSAMPVTVMPIDQLIASATVRCSSGMAMDRTTAPTAVVAHPAAVAAAAA